MSLLAIFTLVVGCYEDKGNYDYKNINRITINDLVPEDGWSSSFGSTLTIRPEIVFEDPTADISHLKYQWDIKGMTREGWDKRDFSWVADTIISGYVTLSITDPITGVVYAKSYDLRINPEFDPSEGGIVVLSEKDGESQLSFVILDLEMNTDKKHITVLSDKIYPNVYHERQKEVLGHGPISIHQHYTKSSGSGGAGTQYLILQNSGPVDVVSKTLTKDIDLSVAFIGGSYPPSINKIEQAAFMSHVSVVVDQDGRLYSRIKMATDLFHSSYFFNEPLKFEEEVLKNIKLFRAPFDGIGFTLLCDSDNKRFLTIYDSKPSQFGNPSMEDAGKILIVPAAPKSTSEIVPKEFIPLNNFGEYELVNGGYYKSNRATGIGYFMIFKNTQGEYFGQEFEIYKDGTYGTELIVEKVGISKLNLPKDPSIVFPIQYLASGSKDVFIAIDNVLYRFDRFNPGDGVKEYLRFDSEIVSFSSEIFNNYWGVVVLANGELHILNLPLAKQLADKDKIIHSLLPSRVDLGNIKHAITKSPDNWLLN